MRDPRRTARSDPDPDSVAAALASTESGGDDRASVLARDQAQAGRIRQGDVAAFEQLFLAYYDALTAFVKRYVATPAIAEELVQDLFLAVWRGRERLELRSTLKVYLYHGARNRALTYLRDTRSEQAETTALPMTILADAGMRETDERPLGAAEQVELDDLAAAAADVVERLPTRCRTAYQLRQHGLTYGEIAEVMQVSPHTVKIQLGRAFRVLRQALEPWLR